MNRIVAAALAAVLSLGIASSVQAQEKRTRISIGTGGTGGVYYPLGGGIASVLSKHVPGVDATAEVTAGSVANLQLLGSGKSEMGFTMADSAWDAYNGLDKFKDKVPLRTLVVFYPNRMHVVTVEGTGVNKMADLKGKRVSTGAPASGTEVMAMRLIEASGLDPNKDMTRERLSVAESVNALKDGKIDALFWVGGVPTPSITDLAATPGKKIKLIDHGDGAEAMRFEDERLPCFGRRENRRVLLPRELARLIPFTRRDADIGAGQQSAKATALESRLHDPEPRALAQRVIHR